MTGYDAYANHPKLAQWFSAVQSELNPEMDEANAILYKVVAKVNKAKL